MNGENKMKREKTGRNVRHGVREIYHGVREVNHGVRVVYHGVREVKCFKRSFRLTYFYLIKHTIIQLY